MNKYRQTVFVLLMSLIMALSGVLASADTISDLKEKKAEIKTQEKKAKDLLEDVQTEKSAVQTEILQLDVQLDEAQEALQFITEELEKTSDRLNTAEGELDSAQKSRAEQYETLKKRMRYMYENGNVGYLDVIFEAADFSDLINRYEYVSKIIEFDDKLIDELIKTEQLITDTVAEIAVKKKEQEILAAKQEEKRDDLEASVEQKNAVMANLNKDEQSYDQQIKELAATSNDIEALIKDAEAKAEAARKAAEKAAAEKAEAARRAASSVPITYNGVFGWPVQGFTQINDVYGNRKNPISGKKEFHTGIDIKANTGTNILAAASGMVISSKYMNGYGNTVIIDHGGGVSTLYGHNSKLLVSVGQEVSKGMVIAKAGSTGYSTGPHCHFEVRENGSAVSPWTYLK